MVTLSNMLQSLTADWTTSQFAVNVRLAAALFVGTAIVGGLLVIYLPPTYFIRSQNTWGNSHPALYWTIRIVRNLLGIVLIGLGIVMLVLPGQGLLTILVGFMLLSIPGKRKLAASAVRRSGMLDSVNRFRVKFGRQPLTLPGKSEN
jgi:hypothetical protein